MKIQNINPYSQHYRCMAQLIHNATLNDIFTYLLDEHLLNLRHEKGVLIPLSNKAIANHVGISRNIISPNLKKLEEMNLIFVSSNGCCINEDYLVSVVSLFNSQKTAEGKQKVSELFRAADIRGLKQMGLSESVNGRDELLDLHGKVPIEHVSDASCTDVCIDATHAQMCARPCTDVGTRNNIINNKKNKSPLQEIEEKNNEIKAIKEELEALKEQVKEKTTNSQSKNKNYDEEPEDDEEDEEDIKARRRQSFQLDIIELKGPGADESEEEAEERAKARTARYRESIQNGTYRMPYHFQFYSRQEAEELISDINKCVMRPDQIFINQLWEVLTEFMDFKFGEEPDEEDLIEGKHPQSLDPEEYFITPKELKDVLKTATESTIQIIETGMTEDGDELEGLTGEEFNVDDVRLLMTWPQKTLADIGEVYIPSKEGFRDIKRLQEGLLSTKSPKRDPEKAERDYTYMQAIMVMADRHDGIEDLTLAEYVAYHFIWDHLQLDNNLRVVDYQLDEFTGNRIKELSRDGVIRLKMELKEEGMDFQDFLGTLNNGKVDAQGWLLFGKRAFSADAITSWNEKNGCESKIPGFIEEHRDILVEAPYDGPEIEPIGESWEDEEGGY
uniref:Catabolite activation-like protein n=1 Tax=virus sp. ctuZj11 TaxID=2825825 RepID=A0A8S5RA05_9VIRU|nr:MAG TPA: Catabolite activation-like protein [virus sp. ctuZj11]